MIAATGPNPFEYLSFRSSPFENHVSIFEWDALNQRWILYKEISQIPKAKISYRLNGIKEGQFSKIFPVYDWMSHNGYDNFGSWAEQAAQKAGR